MGKSAFTGKGAKHRFGQEQTRTEDTQTTPATTDTATSSMSEEAISELLYMIEEEKLAGDIYEAFYALYGIKIFDNIAASEDRHFDALIAQAEKLGLDTDTFVFEPAGSFSDPELQALYDTLLAQGSTSLTDALNVGVAIEEKDMIDIASAAELVAGTALADTYQNLLDGSQYHLDAFEALLA